MTKPENQSANERHLSIVLPGLSGPHGSMDDAVSVPALPLLERVLGKADKLLAAPLPGLDRCLLQLFEIDVPADSDPPVAAVMRVLDMGIVDKDWWIRADPVNLAPQRDSLVLTDGSFLGLTQHEADQLVEEIMEVFADDGWVLKAPRPDRWYLKPAKVPEMTTTSLTDVIGRDIHPYLPKGPDGKDWHTVLNELQILLHTASVNVEREARGALPVNSLWCWGGGRLPILKHCCWTRIWSEEPISLALARLTEGTTQNCPLGADAWMADAEAGKHLLVLDQGAVALRRGDHDAWRAFLEGLERQWIEPLVEVLKTGSLTSLSVYTDDGKGCRLEETHLRRWWRRRRRLGGRR